MWGCGRRGGEGEGWGRDRPGGWGMALGGPDPPLGMRGQGEGGGVRTPPPDDGAGCVTEKRVQKVRGH